MADWRQIQARIRKAKHSPDASAKLSELYERTRDAMVAWELGVVEEKSGNNEEAGKWYSTAFQRFRRADWKKKAEEALTKLGLPLPERSAESSESESAAPATVRADAESETASAEAEPLALGEIPETEDEMEMEPASAEAEPTGNSAAGAPADPNAPGRKKRRRGRRGGRGRGRRGTTAPTGLPARSFADSPETPVRMAAGLPEPGVERRAFERMPGLPVERTFETSRPEARSAPSERPERASKVDAVPQLPSERVAHGRGDPGLTSRMAYLESMLRRMVASPMHTLDEAESAPAGPGVFLLSESDQTTSYYIESCQTLRIGVGNLMRGGRVGRGGRGGRGEAETSSLKSRLAEHLGINEAKVAQYLKDHCAVRWIQLDDEAAHLAHFAIGVLRTPLNLD